jgi:predicted lipoprotein with Yx(FWY)xxD motif
MEADHDPAICDMQVAADAKGRKRRSGMADMKRSMKKIVAIAGFALATAAVGGAPAQTARAIAMAEKAPVGAYLTDRSGAALYMFEEDRRGGDRGRAVESDCEGDCLTRWPIFSGEPVPEAAAGIDAALIGSFTRPDGKVQATYNGWPLYYFAEDFAPGDIKGHEVDDFGGEWYLIAPTGLVIGNERENRVR